MQLHCIFVPLLVLLTICNEPSVALSSTKMEDGDFLKIVSVSSGNVRENSNTKLWENNIMEVHFIFLVFFTCVYIYDD